MDVRGSAWIGNRPDRQKLVTTVEIGRVARTLEILVARLIDPAIPDIVIPAIRVALPISTRAPGIGRPFRSRMRPVIRVMLP